MSGQTTCEYDTLIISTLCAFLYEEKQPKKGLIMITITDLIDLSPSIVHEESTINFGILILAAVAEHLYPQGPSGNNKRNKLRRAASVLAEFKTELQFSPIPLLKSHHDDSITPQENN